MSEQEYKIKPVGVKYICDVCNEGKMLPDGDIVLTSYPPQFPHKCDNCGHKENFTVKYPNVRFTGF